ncbi:catechol 2,3-dioxygenase-like lactoylglutathione lyase family enzyme [Salirhabdus euzebyi]|uniref:Catechol 2,3-dioxygenase-like lactoylglutathione lyase family enzyme n=1 Tax=Salirhabdus euzebyi TaxID=394506 RepID=A0A841PXR9_9BACI|nr:VOC family protein [Salirhabdus euzebyi]MBB6452296.1 catechol 2,3-dioxygenase-like lactoylglutathione lyase family enzyme [Salirhabdus euzebyi]
MFHVKGIDHIQLAAPEGCEEEARKFFTGLLGLKEVEKPDGLKKNGGVWFQCGNQEIHIGVESAFLAAKKAHPAFYIEQIEELYEYLATHHVAVEKDNRLPGYTRFYAKDPFGNRLEFLERKKDV